MPAGTRPLRAVASLGAGVDHALGQAGLVPEGVEVLRIVDPLMGERMATWVLWAVINFQRRMDEYGRAQAERRWDKTVENYRPWDNGRVRVGVMGLGVMGGAVARLLRAAGYDVAAWVRSPRAPGGGEAASAAAAVAGAGGGGVAGEAAGASAGGGSGAGAGAGAGGGAAGGGLEAVRVFAGRGALRPFVERTDVLVCLLPLTPETSGILSAELLSWLPKGAAVINAARGRHLDEQALLAGLDSGDLGGAVLDVFATEPLPPSSPLWTHPRVRITPHVSSITDVPNAAAQIADNWRRLCEGRPLANVASRTNGY
ncbi:hypothetical protein HYH03_011984 [Edaphochlamys debaryana]|uniref:D-isomer specific 2-hydroxyacid dehydrogenase NAD-binding domain-containing protein n=1 Tax=Edaphochlamys debaryana TaxID=47281 RepID=A0A835XV13_9CHLO|nr:hypothetical protein HYH03_011984 [Edaphochlamys debaryana]|eukprot:KAG2489533.1 hypothetical protein HYH03_011984 [Edaphochlamys debaryana]